jgi:DNA-binding transcriptional regulator YhcF (GntR family)
MTSIEKVFNELEEQGLVYKSLNNELSISISASDYLDIKRLTKEMHKQEIIDAWKNRNEDVIKSDGKTAEQYYQETFKNNNNEN